MGKYQKILLGFLVILISSSVIITLNDQVRMRIDNDKTTFYVPHEDYPWIWTVSGREYNRLFDGSSLMRRDVSSIRTETLFDNEIVIIKRHTLYIRGPLIVDTYSFRGDVRDINLFPISHKVEIFNASGFFYRYEVRDLIYDGNTTKLDGETFLSFGRNMKVELNPNYRWAWVYKDGIVKAQYDIPSDYEVFYVKLFDPTPTVELWEPDNETTDLTATTYFTANITETTMDIYNFSLWHNISGTWTLNQTEYLELPDNQEDDTLNELNMTGNVLLFHFNNDLSYGENATRTYDFSGNGNNGTIPQVKDNDAFINQTTYKLGNGSLHLDGDTDYLIVDNDASFGSMTDWTISYWVYPIAYNAADQSEVITIFGPTAGTDYKFEYGHEKDGDYYMVVASEDCSTTNLNGPNEFQGTAPPLNQWTHVTWVTVGYIESSNGKTYIYVNGILVDSYDHSRTTICDVSAGDIWIGARAHGGGGEWFDGMVDEISIWDRNLSATEIKRFYNMTKDYKVNYTVEGIPDGYYKWNVQSWDNESNFAWYAKNWTFTVGTIEDTTAPKWYDNSTNSTVAGTFIKHSVRWTDDTSLANYTFSFDNGTGTLVNDSITSMTGTANWSNVTKGVNNTVGSSIRWMVYTNDSSNNMNVTDTFTYTTTSAVADCWVDLGDVVYIPTGCEYYISDSKYVA